jgi:3',5'-cyclic AMP phosphodiesterase CpdA
MLARLGADLHELAPEHTVVTGDLTHISLPQEFRQAHAWLQTLGPAERVTVVPGNHDCYVPTEWAETLGLWQDYMRGDDAGDAAPAALFPLLRVRGPVAFIGLSTAVPSAPLMATGRIGAAQFERLEALLAALEGRDLLRVLLLHHPPVPGEEKWRKRLVDAPRLCALLARRPVDMVLHGHRHRALHSVIRIPGSNIPVFGIPSASAMGIHSDYPSEYNEYEVQTGESSWQLSARARSWDAGLNSYRSEALASFTVARRAA